MINIGILGAGPNGTGNARRLAEHSTRCKIAAIADPQPDNARKLAEDHRDAVLFDDLAPMLDAVDAVVISSPNWLHPEQAITAAEAGKHVWIEKPMALTTADADRIVQAVDAAKVASMIGFSVRFSALHQEMKKRVTAGELGEIVSIWSRRLCNLKFDGQRGWRADFERSGGVMSELMTHEIDWIVDLIGLPQSVFCRKFAYFENQHARMNDHVWMTMNYGGETTATIEGSQRSWIPDFYKGVLGRDGGLFTTDWGRQLEAKDAEGNSSKIELGEAFNKHAHWLDVIEGRCASVADVHYGREITKLIERALDSVEKAEVVALD